MRVCTLALFLTFAFVRFAFAQTTEQGRGCSTEAYLEVLKRQDPGFEERSLRTQQAVQQLMRQRPAGQAMQQATITIPVVFHVVYKTGSENISDTQVLSQLAVLNEDFRRLNADTTNTPDYFRSFAADTRIEFCLAMVDPNGNPTSGITRTLTNKESFSYFSDQIKSTANGGLDAWDTKQYLNIWIGNLGTSSIGYASSPSALPDRDGVVLHYRTVGAAPFNNSLWAYNRGRTATHEVGHWLGLKHIWGNGMTCNDTDDIDDTPNQLTQTDGCPDGIEVSCDNGPYGNMWQNYMDYSDDACMSLFTKGQAAYMQGILQSARGYMFESTACTGELRSRFSTAQPQDTLLAPGDQVQFLGSFAGFKPTQWLWEFEGGTPASSTAQNPTVRYNRPGRYRVTLTTSNEKSSHTLSKEEYIYVTAENVKVYPNPASGYIILEQAARQQIQVVELMNRHGQVLLREQVEERVIRLDVQHLPAGMYLLRTTSTNGIAVTKVSIVK
ncbi:M43 family zinc metalloprotease [Pontibacter lucknowensis]|uniref:Por secretion system C-terminal sorting domain-containing protein n=1 Tax=Pontibacter lucknowensis TaxID=1077936 RepID=A0A1N6UTU5_9BACT|nr:M43 family zinc metalloprotease [Pontibacter lucknowensis]SIQ69064.1 Por secretion system C-terminal sorting domain-containing protein [Pontibacter lucknowensis]